MSKDALRDAALEARKAFVRTLDDGRRARLEERLARHLTAECAAARVVAGYSPMGSEISPLLAMEEARAVGRIVAFPAFSNPAKPFKFIAADPAVPGPFGILQPKGSAPAVDPDLILVPLLAIDRTGARLGRGKGHYDRVLGRVKRSGARLIGIGWGLEMLATEIPSDPWDVQLDAFASPEGIQWFNRSGHGH
ncbi:5-formyltetrahydrofolate cyclo-ligase [Sphingomonas sabuli]|uniref:5-formyltetrahydrofolate cyclo-ligase n=1 Tax=Sphingomonas sabuli TaxID=2764186 RepID=A0A7G9L2S8_9SPHN|nr:5-formyltetrahydrofolate cyclo-ligase [Sphingomonas sabuli]QNM82927.1 5-formyltetrahydrofolate cyclo-ligase [Sphingomonas sabuli]